MAGVVADAQAFGRNVGVAVDVGIEIRPAPVRTIEAKTERL